MFSAVLSLRPHKNACGFESFLDLNDNTNQGELLSNQLINRWFLLTAMYGTNYGQPPC